MISYLVSFALNLFLALASWFWLLLFGSWLLTLVLDSSLVAELAEYHPKFKIYHSLVAEPVEASSKIIIPIHRSAHAVQLCARNRT
jgi:hypothetical protein